MKKQLATRSARPPSGRRHASGVARRHPDFNPPARRSSLKGRTTTLAGLFVLSITPFRQPSVEDVDLALSILGMKRGKVTCAYCGGNKTEWDHFRPVVKKGRPSGYITEIQHLVPSCGRCNQSKSGSHWKDWILGSASKSPKTLKVVDLRKRVARLDRYERWRRPTRINYSRILDHHTLSKHFAYLGKVLAILSTAEKHAARIRSRIEERRNRSADR